MRFGSIYKIICLTTNKVYIGQTVQSPPIKRWLEHYDEMTKQTNQLFLYRAIRKHGIENFIFQILEQNIPLKDLNNKEIFYISFYNSNNSNYGYNLTKGGFQSFSSKISEEDALNIIEYIKNEKEKTFVEISNIFNISREMVSDINTGETWYFDHESYPIRDNSHFKNKLSEDDIYDIYSRLSNEDYLTEIANDYNVSITNISNINRGKIYKFLPDDKYPIFKPINSKTRLQLEKAKKIIELLVTHPEYSYSKIGFILSIGRKTVSGVNNGTLYVDLAKTLGIINYPIR